MNETTEPRLTEKPSWFELSENEKLEHLYWTSTGTFVDKEVEIKPKWFWQKPKKKIIKSDGRNNWLCVCHSKEEAEAYAVVPCDNWVWNGEPATSRPLQEFMNRARQKGRLGVAVIGYKNGKWVTLKEYSADVPLMSDD